MQRRLREVEKLLRDWCRTDYGAMWLRQATQQNGIIRVGPGQIVPVVHIIAIKGHSAFIAPPEKIREGHRSVGGRALQSGRPLADGELALRPEIRFEVVEDDALIAAMGSRELHVAGVREPSQVFTVPAIYLLAPTAWPKRAFVLYQHIFGEGTSWPIDGWFYVGVTTRSWQRRWSEHRRAAETGSPLLFHSKLRDDMAAGRVTYVHHKVMGITDVNRRRSLTPDRRPMLTPL